MDTQSLRGPLGWSLASIIVIIAFCVYSVFALATPFLQQGRAQDTAYKTTTLVEKYNQFVAVDIARFNGRSAFFKYIRIAPPPPPKQEEIPEPDPIIIVEEKETGPPDAPLKYMGPALIAIIGDEAWFRGGSGPDVVIRLKAGEEQDGLKVVKTTPPAIVTVEHRHGEYDINLFSNEEPFFRDDAPPVVQDAFLEEVEG